ncbi:MAG: hypothetical protein HFJ04_02945 [Lachnospiraceae bacterium]|nr:hypothetical protein [Lachnospiraceae bacterium]
MNRLKAILAVLLITAIFTVSGTEHIYAAQIGGMQRFFSSLFGAKGADAADKGDLVVVLDAGHGGYDNGAVGNGLKEKALTLKIAGYCKAELEKYKGVKVYMTRANDTYLALDKRVSIASGVKADVFVSIHINSAGISSANGAEVFYPNSNYKPSIGAEGKKLANGIQKNLTALGLRSRGIKTLNSQNGSTYPDGSPSDYYAVIRGSKNAGFPGIIVEHAFISNASDAKTFLSTNTALKKLGIADAKGIAASYGLKKSEDSTDTLQKTKITRLVGKSSKSVSLKWNKVAGAGGYEIYRSTKKNGSYSRVATVKKAGSVTYTDKTVKNGKNYYYKIRAYKGSGDSKITSGFCTAQNVKLLKKPAISAKSQAAKIKVSWKKVGGAAKYEIYRCTSKNGSFKKIATVKDAASYMDTKKKSNKTYYYKVRAVGSGIQGNTYSSFSEIEQIKAK